MITTTVTTAANLIIYNCCYSRSANEDQGLQQSNQPDETLK